jgi:hypothetical protein
MPDFAPLEYQVKKKKREGWTRRLAQCILDLAFLIDRVLPPGWRLIGREQPKQL